MNANVKTIPAVIHFLENVNAVGAGLENPVTNLAQKATTVWTVPKYAVVRIGQPVIIFQENVSAKMVSQDLCEYLKNLL